MSDETKRQSPEQQPEEPTIRFELDPALLHMSQAENRERLEDTYVGAPLLPPEPLPAPEPAPRKTMPCWAKTACICVAVAATIVACMLLLPRGASAEQTAETFLSAMDAGDFSLLATVAEGSGIELTADNTAPLFVLYGADADFQSELRETLMRQAEHGASDVGMFRLVRGGSGARRDYRVVIAPGEAVVETNLSAAQITVGRVQAVWDAQLGASVAAGLLPGSYQVAGAFTAPYGDAFEARTQLRVNAAHNSCALKFDYSTVEVYNSAPEPVRIEVGGSEYATLEPEQELTISPVAPQTEIAAVSPRDEVLSAPASDGYLYVHFEQCQVEVYNDYDVPMFLAVGGAPYAEIPPQQMLTLEHVAAGEELTASLDPRFGLMASIYRVEYDYGYFYPEMRLNDAQFEQLRVTVETYALAAYEAYAQGAQALEQLPRSALTQMLLQHLQEPQPPEKAAESVALESYGPLLVHEGGVIRMSAQIVLQERAEPPQEQTAEPPAQPVPALQETPETPAAESAQPDEDDTVQPAPSKAWTLWLQLEDGVWSILPDEAPQSDVQETAAPPEIVQ